MKRVWFGERQHEGLELAHLTTFSGTTNPCYFFLGGVGFIFHPPAWDQ